MDRTARLIQAAEDVRRKIWASLPIRIRLADFFFRMAVTSADAFGQTMFELFAKHGLDVPPPRSHEAREFGKKVFANLLGKFHNPALVEDVMSSFAIRFMDTGVKHLAKDATLKEAENYVLLGVTREALNVLRSKKKKREVGDIYVSEGEERRHDLPIFDEDAADRLLFKRLPPKIQRKLEGIHQDAPLYVKLHIQDGLPDPKIIGDVGRGVPSLLPHPYGRDGRPLTRQSWSTTYKPKIFEVLKNDFEEFGISV